MASMPPVTLAEFKTRFARDFQYGTGLDKVTDTDINTAFADSMPAFNPSLFSSSDGKLAFLYAAAHFLVMNVQAAGGLQAQPVGQGISNEAQDVIVSKSVGGISMSVMEPPEFIAKSHLLRQFWTTDYGRRYLAMLQPRLVGVVRAIEGPLAPDTIVSPTIPFAEES